MGRRKRSIVRGPQSSNCIALRTIKNGGGSLLKLMLSTVGECDLRLARVTKELAVIYWRARCTTMKHLKGRVQAVGALLGECTIQAKRHLRKHWAQLWVPRIPVLRGWTRTPGRALPFLQRVSDAHRGSRHAVERVTASQAPIALGPVLRGLRDVVFAAAPQAVMSRDEPVAFKLPTNSASATVAGFVLSTTTKANTEYPLKNISGWAVRAGRAPRQDALLNTVLTGWRHPRSCLKMWYVRLR